MSTRRRRGNDDKAADEDGAPAKKKARTTVATKNNESDSDNEEEAAGGSSAIATASSGDAEVSSAALTDAAAAGAAAAAADAAAAASDDDDDSDSDDDDDEPTSSSDMSLEQMEARKEKLIKEIRLFQAHAGVHRPCGPEPRRVRAHWDFLLQEMEWMANDFKRERRWNVAVSRTLSDDIVKQAEAAGKVTPAHVPIAAPQPAKKEKGKAKKGKKGSGGGGGGDKADKAAAAAAETAEPVKLSAEERAEAAHKRKLAAAVSLEITKFWSNIGRMLRNDEIKTHFDAVSGVDSIVSTQKKTTPPHVAVKVEGDDEKTAAMD
jgi:hypothetical protein